MARLDEVENAFRVVAGILNGQPSATDIRVLSRIEMPLRTDDQEIRRLM